MKRIFVLLLFFLIFSLPIILATTTGRFTITGEAIEEEQEETIITKIITKMKIFLQKILPSPVGGVFEVSEQAIPPTPIPEGGSEEEGGCVSNWKCEDWSECIDNIENRVCTDLNECEEAKVEVRVCLEIIEKEFPRQEIEYRNYIIIFLLLIIIGIIIYLVTKKQKKKVKKRKKK